MAWYRQASQPWQASGVDPLLNLGGDQRASPRLLHDHGGRGHPSLIRSRLWRSKKFSRSAAKKRHFSIGVFVIILFVAMIVTFFGGDYLFSVVRTLQGDELPSWLPGSDHEQEDLQFFDPREDGVFVIKNENVSLDGYKRQSFGDDGRTEKEEEELRASVKSKKKGKHPATACEIAFRNSTSGLREPSDMSVFEQFNLNYVRKEEKPEDDPQWEPKFAGHQSLAQREASYHARDQTLHCGFVEGPDGYPDTGFELSKEDQDYMKTCHIAVSSCIFGNYDHLRNPKGKKVSVSSKEKVCFAMFVDEASLEGIIEEGEVPDGNMTRGLWRIVLIKTLPYSDNRRTGKVPKFLTHRLFPNAKYSIWLDSKLRLQSDPLLILEHFLWNGRYEYAISNHYDRHCVWEEVAQNKKLNKFSHSVIDQQFEFYQKDGLTRFNASDPHKLLPSHVPEGSFIVRAHTPMSNLFSCLWFNEVERFTSRDQLSFAYTYLKYIRTNPTSRFRFNMFKDCERREMTKLYHHKSEEVVKH